MFALHASIFIYTALLPFTSVLGKATVDNQIVLLEQSNSTLLQYPTQLTQNIVPKSIHSHNDYWRDVPLLLALSYGVASVEADVWLVDTEGTLLIGHELAALTPDRNFSSLYIDPLVAFLDAMNPNTTFTEAGPPTINGPFDTSSGTPLQLLVDVKTDGDTTLPFVITALEPLRERGYLSTVVNGSLQLSAVLVVGTGNTPLDGVKALQNRDVFFDAPLTQLFNASLNTTFGPTLSPLASTDFGAAVGWSGIGNITEGQRANITQWVNDAHSLGIRSRFWDTPGWPIHARDNVWRELLNDGSDWLNADDLEAAANF